MNVDPLRIVFIAGQGRSGSTVVDRVLGALTGAFSATEVYRIWEEGFLEDRPCSCGSPFSECPFWSAVAAELACGPSDLRRIVELHGKVDHSRHFFRVARAAGENPASGSEVSEYRGWLERLYRGIASASGSSLIIDSSKVPSRALLLAGIPSFAVSVVHLVRDPRATVYAWQKKDVGRALGARPLPRFSLFKTVGRWITRNLACELLARRLPYVRVRYEDFARNPAETMNSAIEQLGLPREGSSTFEGASISLPAIHSVAGNPGRLRTGPTQIRLDADWRASMSPMKRLTVTALTLPLLVRYGYAGRS